MGLWTTLIGYSPKQDRVIQYEVELETKEYKIVEDQGLVEIGHADTRSPSEKSMGSRVFAGALKQDDRIMFHGQKLPSVLPG
jgi:hypothetical protein